MNVIRKKNSAGWKGASERQMRHRVRRARIRTLRVFNLDLSHEIPNGSFQRRRSRTKELNRKDRK